MSTFYSYMISVATILLFLLSGCDIDRLMNSDKASDSPEGITHEAYESLLENKGRQALERGLVPPPHI